VHVDDVVAALAQLLSERADRLRKRREVRHGAVHREPDRAAERHHVIGQGPPLRGGAAVAYTCQAIVGVVGRQEPDLMAEPRELLGQSFNMAPDAAWIRVRVRRHERYTHRATV
jgi:hypothetical protein